jgi:two-component system, NarL family, nitrate/nitrite response regulator NarL
MARILVVDDHRSVLWGLAKLIESAGPPLELAGTASTPAQALAALQELRPDIVLLDLMLGASSGEALVGEMRRAGASVVIVSGVIDSSVQERAIMEGASGFVHKSEPAEVILAAIARVSTGGVWLDGASVTRMFSTMCAVRNAAGVEAVDALTPAERNVIVAVVRLKSKPNKVIASELGISAHTLRNHLASIYDKLALNRRVELVLFALERKMDQAPSARAPARSATAHR